MKRSLAVEERGWLSTYWVLVDTDTGEELARAGNPRQLRKIVARLEDEGHSEESSSSSGSILDWLFG